MPRILISIILFVITILIGIFLVWPNYLKFQNFQQQIKNKETELQYLEEYYQDLADLSEKLKGYQEELSKIDSALPESPDLPSFANFFQKTASENGLILKSLGSFSINPLAQKTEIKEISFSPELSGSYSSFKNFLKALEKSSRMIEVENISFSSPKEGEIFDFKLEIKTHSY